MPYNESILNTKIAVLETGVLKKWKEEKIFEQSVEQRPIDNQFVLYDGPPFATGLPHYGHVLAHSIKDVIPRYQTMQGKRVERRFGWDCHGVPVEHEVEKTMKIQGHENVAAFNEACRSIVQRYTNEWRAVEDRLGRFVDMDNDYKTMDPSFMESVWSVFKQINDKGLVYEGKKVVAYSPELGTALSDFESKLNYKKVQDHEVTLSFSLDNQPNTKLLVWTTTPWSVPTNVAIAINKKIEYVKIKTKDGNEFILAKNAVSKYFADDSIEATQAVTAESLVGLTYRPLFQLISEEKLDHSYSILESPHVTDTDGTGLVHISPAFGEDDYMLGQKHQLPVMDYFDKNGNFKEELVELGSSANLEAKSSGVKGKFFKDADKLIIDNLKSRGYLFKQGTLHHEYPFCWRTDKPLMYRAVTSWYVNVLSIKDKIIANNQKINWYPDHVGKRRFHEWLSNARDWAISRSRYWGTPIPVWRNEKNPADCIIIGSIAEFEQLTGKKVTDLHRHFIDDIVIEKDGATYRRIPEVFDCWFESGAMPYAQAHYPFENKQQFEATFPANFIAEGLDQTRGWFYTLMVLATALFDKPAFMNCMVNGILLGDDGKKMSKSKRNYPNLETVFDKYGADALRFLLLGSGATQAKEMKVAEKDIESISRIIQIPLLNIYKLFATRANLEGFQPVDDIEEKLEYKEPLDQWLFTNTERFKAQMKKCYDNFDLISACQEIRDYIETFSKLYVRNSKQRFKYADKENVRQGLACMHHALDTISKCIAPIMPFMSDIIYLSLYPHKKSVHLEFWPQPLPTQEYREAYDSIEAVREIIHLGHTVRQDKHIELKQPLSNVYLPANLRGKLSMHEALLKDALNVEKITWIDGDVSTMLTKSIILNDKVLGPKHKTLLKQIKENFKRNNYQFEGDNLVIGDITLDKEDYSINYLPSGDICGAASGAIWLTMDTKLTPDLQEKGYFRKIQHDIQMMRKELGYTPRDTVTLQISGNDTFINLVRRYEKELSEHTLTTIEYKDGNNVNNLKKEFAFEGYTGQVHMPLNRSLASTRTQVRSSSPGRFGIFPQVNNVVSSNSNASVEELKTTNNLS